MSDFAMAWLAGLEFDPASGAYQVLEALARRHEKGPITLPTATLAAQVKADPFTVWWLLFELTLQHKLIASNIGGLMSVTLGCDFETSAHRSALPTAGQEAGR
ncbi:MAG: hypothetical protein ABJL55_16430 [Roseibium sp.]